MSFFIHCQTRDSSFSTVVSSPSKEQAGLYSFQPLAFSLRHLRAAQYNIDAYLEGIRIFRIDGEVPRFFVASEKAVGSRLFCVLDRCE